MAGNEMTASLTDAAPYHNARAGGEDSAGSPELDRIGLRKSGFEGGEDRKTTSAKRLTGSTLSMRYQCKEV
jgi:hypothetical protein